MVFFNKDNFISARFVNDRKMDIEVLFEGPTGISACFVEVDTSQEDFKELLKIVSLDQISENTSKWIKEQQQLVINLHKKIIDSGYRDSQNASVSNSIKVSELLLSFDTQNIKHKEALVEAKLEVLDSGSFTTEQKKQIKNAKSILELAKLI
jgi:hypothetical protein